MKRTTHRLGALAREEAGAALLEFALFAGVLLVLTFGIIDFGRALFTANNLTAAAREGARYAAVLPNPGPASTPAIQQRVATYMSPFGSTPVDPATQVHVTYNSAGSSVQSITVEVHYPFTWLTPIRALLGGSFTDTLHARARFRWEAAIP